jgi:hypothetical protein
MDLPDNLIMLIDRSQESLSNLNLALTQADAHGLGYLYSSSLRRWMTSPVHGHFMIEIFNRVDRSSRQIMGDDFLEMLDEVDPLVRAFLADREGNGRVAWLGLLSPVMKGHFAQWLQSHGTSKGLFAKGQSTR